MKLPMLIIKKKMADIAVSHLVSSSEIMKHVVISAKSAILRFHHFIMIQFEIDVL